MNSLLTSSRLLSRAPHYTESRPRCIAYYHDIIAQIGRFGVGIMSWVSGPRWKCHSTWSWDGEIFGLI